MKCAPRASNLSASQEFLKFKYAHDRALCDPVSIDRASRVDRLLAVSPTCVPTNLCPLAFSRTNERRRITERARAFHSEGEVADRSGIQLGHDAAVVGVRTWNVIRSSAHVSSCKGADASTGATVPLTKTTGPVITRASSHLSLPIKWPSSSAPPSTSTLRTDLRCNSENSAVIGSSSGPTTSCSHSSSLRSAVHRINVRAEVSKTFESTGRLLLRSMTTRSGGLPTECRTFSLGLSLITVRLPTKMACSSDRHR